MNLGAASGQMIVIPVGTTVGVEVSIHGVIGMGMVALLVFLICSEHLFWMLVLFFVYNTAINIGGFESGWRGVIKLQTVHYPFDIYLTDLQKSPLLWFHHMLCLNTCCLCCSVLRNFCEVWLNWRLHIFQVDVCNPIWVHQWVIRTVHLQSECRCIGICRCEVYFWWNW